MRPDVERFLEENNIAELQKLSYYDLFNVSKELSDEDLTQAVTAKYRQLALRFHPDRTQGDLIKADVFKLIGNAYNTLINKDQRREYDFRFSGPFHGNAHFFATSNFVPSGESFNEFVRNMDVKIAERKSQEAKTERVVKAFLIRGGTDVERTAILTQLKAEHSGSTGIGIRCVGSIMYEQKESRFSDTHQYIYSYDEGDYSKNTHAGILFSNERILGCHNNEEFIKRLAKAQGNVTTLKIEESACCIM